MVNEWESTIEALGTLRELREEVTSKLNSIASADGSKYDTTIGIPGVGYSITEVDLRIIGLLELALELKPENNSLIVPQNLVLSFRKQLNQIINHYSAVNGGLEKVESEGGGVGSFDLTDSPRIVSKNEKIVVELGGNFKNIWNNSEAGLSNVYTLIQMFGTKSFGDFSGAFAALSNLTKRFEKERLELHEACSQQQENMKQVLENGQKVFEELSRITKSSSQLQEELSRVKSEGDNDRKTLAEYASEGTNKIASIRATSEDAAKLKQNVDSYQAQFTDFQSQLDARQTAIKNGTERQQSLLENLEKIEETIQDTNQRSESMLSGATVAGLASSFGGIRDDLTIELRNARRIFYFSILVLFLSVIPLMAYVFPGIFGDLGGVPASLTQGNDKVGALEFLGQVAARALLLIPAAWFAKFAAARHAALFRLKEHYAYKYSVASSVDGFKQQAAPYQDQIAAATFFELTFNPADKMDAKSTELRHPNPAMEWLMKKLKLTHDGES